MADLGVSFVPNPRGSGDRPSDQGVEPTQEAIKILSLRLPKVVGGGAFAPAPLLQGTGSAGNPLARSALGQTQQRVLQPPPGGMSPQILGQVLQILAGGGGGGAPSPWTPNPEPAMPFGLPPSAAPTVRVTPTLRSPTAPPLEVDDRPVPPPTYSFPQPDPLPQADFPRTPWGDFYAPDYGPFGTEG